MRFPFLQSSLASILCLSILCLGSPSRAAEPDPALRSYRTGNGFLNRGLDELAIKEYRDFLEQRPDHEQARTASYGLGVALFRLGRQVQAIAALEPIVDSPHFEFSSETELLLGQCYLMVNRFSDAATQFQTFLNEAPTHSSAPAASAMLVESLYRADDYASAQHASTLFLQRWPQDERRDRVHFFSALSSMSLRDYREAVNQFDTLVDEKPDSPLAIQATLFSGQCLQQLGVVPQAIERFRSVIQHAPQALLPDALYGLATLLQSKGDLNAAGALFDQLIESAPELHDISDAMLRRGVIWFLQGQYDRARTAFRKADGQPQADHPAVNYWLAKCSLRLDYPQDAADRLAQGLAEAPDHPMAPEMLYDLAVAQLQLNQPAKADETLVVFSTRFPDHTLAADALAIHASALHRLERYIDSAALCDAFLESYPAHPRTATIRYLRAESFYLMGELNDAQIAFGQYLKLSPEEPDAMKARFRLGSIYYTQGEYTLAVPLLQTVTAEQPTTDQFQSALLMLGEIAFANQDWRRAESLYEQYELGGDTPDADIALLKLGLARQRRGEYATAIQAYSTLLERHPKSPESAQAQFEQAQSLIALNRFAEATTALDRVVNDLPNSPFIGLAYNHLGAIAATKNDYDSAIRFFQQSLSLSKNADQSVDTLYRLGLSLASAGRNARAAEVFDRLNREHPNNRFAPEADARRLLALAKSGDAATALALISDLEQHGLETLDSQLTGAIQYEKAWLLRTHDQPDEASVAYRELLSAPLGDDLRAHAQIELADLEIAKEHYEPAAQLLRDLMILAVQGAVNDPALVAGAQYRLGLCEYRLKNHEASLELLDQYLRSDSADSSLVDAANVMAGESSHQLNRHQDAVRFFTAVIEHTTDQEMLASSLLRIGESEAAMQRWSASERAYTDFLERFEESPFRNQAQFGQGWAQENQSRLNDAIATYTIIVDRSEGPTACRAQFQIGECLFAQRKYDQAVAELLKVDVLYAYPQWSAAALYEAGRCFEALNQPAAAQAQFERIRSEFGDSKWSPMAASRLTALSVSTSTLPAH